MTTKTEAQLDKEIDALAGSGLSTVSDQDIEALQKRISDDIRALPGPLPADLFARHDWLNAAWRVCKVALGQRRAQRGSSRAKARALCGRMIKGDNVTLGELERAALKPSLR